MDAFSSAIDDLFADPNIARDALYRVGGAGDGVVVRVIARRPDEVVDFGETRIHTGTAVFEVRASEVAEPRPGDRIIFDSVDYVVQGEPERRDSDRLVWTLDTRSG